MSPPRNTPRERPIRSPRTDTGAKGAGRSSLLGGGVVRGASAPRRDARTALFVLGALIAVGAIYGVLHNRLAASGKTDPALNGVRTVAAPFATGTARTARTARTFWDYVFPGKRDADALATLEAENTRLRLDNERLRNADAEAMRLRTALGFAVKQTKPLLPAEIIALLPSATAETLLVGRGTRQGVKVGSVARTADGLLGQVTEVGSDTAQVLLLSDTSSGVGVLLKRVGAKPGKLRGTDIDAVVRGRGRGEPIAVVYLRREDDVLPGDIVVSSGYGGVFPAGIPVGKVTQVVPEKTGFVKTAQVEPFAPMPGTLREVFLIR